MDKNLHDIEDLFKKALDDNEENPSQNTWNGIEKKLDNDNFITIRKRYNFLKKVALLLFLLLTGLSIYVWQNQDKNSAPQNNDISASGKEPKTKNDILTPESHTTTRQKPVDSLSINKSNNITQVRESKNKIFDKTILENDNAIQKKIF